MKSRARHAAPPSAGTRLQALLVQLSSLAADDLRRMPQDSERAIHALRTRMKKIRSLLRLARGHVAPMAGQAVGVIVQDIKRAFGEARNEVVTARLRWELSGHQGEPVPLTPGVKWEAPLPEHIAPKVQELRRLIEALPLQALTWDEVDEAYAKTCRSAHKRMKRARTGDAEALHHWRRRVKDLYYQSLAFPHLPGSWKRIKPSRRLGSRLGRHHDLEMLRTCAQPELTRAELKCLLQYQAALEKKIFRLGPRLLG